jgi:S-DNA-T family DNA segregation ATPase FtsK/SpoIIIE
VRLTLTVVDPVASHWVDLRVDADDTATVGDVVPRLVEAVRGRAQAVPAGVIPLHGRGPATREPLPPVFVGGFPLDPAQPLTRSPLRDGVLVSVGDPRGCLLPEPAGLVEIRIAGGPDAGDVVRLPLGEFDIGTAPHAVVRMPRGPGHAVTGTVEPDGTVRLEPVPGVEVRLEQEPLTTATRWEPRVQLRVPDPGGDVVLELAVPGPADAALDPTDDGGLAFNRPPRLAPYHEVVKLVRPQKPEKPGGVHIPWVIALIPLVLGGVMYFVMRKTGGGMQMIYLLFLLMSPVMLIGTGLGNLRSGRKKYRKDMKQYRQDAAEFDGKVDAARRVEELHRRLDQPEPAAALLVAAGPRHTLWERRPVDPDALTLRIGLGDLPAGRVEVRDGAETEPAPITRSVPVSVSLRDAGVVGIAGPRPYRAGLSRWLLLQLAVQHSPVELSLVLLSARPPEDAGEWEWTRWLPHLRGGDGGLRAGLDPQGTAARAVELATLVEARRAAARGGGGFGAGVATFDPVVVVLDGARDLRRLAGVPTVLDDGPALGVYAICLDDEERFLPEECSAVAVLRSRHEVALSVSGRAVVDGVLPDGLGIAHAERAARAMAPVRDVSRDDEGSRLPASARLLAVLGMEHPTPGGIARGWALGGRTTQALLGVGETGPFGVDLRLDGPHGLIAGTTGSGKSELLQTLIASLSVGNRPDEFTFVLIDYKGGAAFKDCVRLPHTVGMVTDLDGHLTTRALESLAAELRRRERRLGRAGAKDIEDYLDQLRPGDEPMPRLLIVIDEFAALVAELPDFVAGLVDVARRGRSLGVHLLLATQRPAGVVSNDIKSNTNLRIALRVTDSEDSQDVIDAADAAHIAKSTPGRAYARLGHSSLIAFQSARVGGKPPSQGGDTPAAAVLPTSFPAEAEPWPRMRVEDGEDDPTRPTDLATLVEAIRGAGELAGITPPPSPWLPALDEVVVLDDLDLPAAATVGVVPPLPFGLGDVPSEQCRSTETFDLERSGHLLVAGSARTGRSTALRAIAGAVGRFTDPRDVHLYGIDCGNNALLPLLSLPHTGAVVTRDQPDRLSRLLYRLLEEVAARQQLLARQGYADVTEQRAHSAPEDRLPYLVVLLDRWEGFMAAYENYDLGKLVDLAYRLLQEGAGVGIKIVLSADRSGLIGKLSTMVEDRLVLRLADPSDYSAVGMTVRDVPDHMPPGRAFRADTLREVQVALLDGDVAGTAQVAALQAIGRAASDRAGELPPASRPARVDQLPVQTTYAEAVALRGGPAPSAAALVGVGGDSLGGRSLDVVDSGPGLLVVGPPRTGRSTTLLTMTRSLLDAGWHAVVLTPRRSPLRELRGRPGVAGVFTTEDEAGAVREVLDGAPRPLVLVVDDLELLDPDGPHAAMLERFHGSIRDSGDAVLAGGSTEDLTSTYRGPVVAIKKSRSGVLLAPRSYNDGELLGARLPREIGGPAPAGRGLLVRGGQWEPVQVALSTPAD